MIEYGRRIDCALNGCAEPHGDNGEAMPWPPSWRDVGPESVGLPILVNGHQAIVVNRAVGYSKWSDRPLDDPIDLLEEFVDDDPCWLDHHGYCQAHNYFGEGECRMARARRLLGRPDLPKGRDA
jgi:hypothetical protein